MARPLIAGIAPDIVCAPGYILRVTALDPSTGLVVSGVTVSGVTIQVQSLDAEELPVTTASIIPLFAYAPG